MVSFSLHDLIKRAMASLSSKLGEHIAVELKLEAAEDNICGDSKQVEEALCNLGSTASNSMPDGGTLSISTSCLTIGDRSEEKHNLPPGSYILLRMEDSGTAIPADRRETIFDPSFNTGEVELAHGIDLPSVFGTVQEHRGTITFETQEGIGTCYEILLPLSSGSPAIEPDMNESSGLVLLVDDEPIMREVIGPLINALGYDVITAANGREALRIYREQHTKISLVLLDMVMPEMSGRDTAMLIRQINPNARFVLLSGYASRQYFQALPFDAVCLKKPVRRHDLDCAIQRALQD